METHIIANGNKIHLYNILKLIRGNVYTARETYNTVSPKRVNLRLRAPDDHVTPF